MVRMQNSPLDDRGQVLPLAAMFILAVLVVLFGGGIALGGTANARAQITTALQAAVLAATAQAEAQTTVEVDTMTEYCYYNVTYPNDTDNEDNGISDNDRDNDNPVYTYTCAPSGGTTLTLGPFDAETVAAIERAAGCVVALPYGNETGYFTICTGWRQAPGATVDWVYPHEGAASIAAQQAFDENIPSGARATVLSWTAAPDRGPSGRVAMSARIVYPSIRTPWGTVVSVQAEVSAAPHLRAGAAAVAPFPG